MIVIGHRGAAGLAPENTVAAIRKAIEVAVDEVEVDVRVAKDNIAVLHHDPYLSYASGRSLVVKEHTLDELRQPKPDLATLGEAIEVVNKHCPLILEVKPDEPTEPIIATVRHYFQQGWRGEHFRFASFSQSTLLALHSAIPEIPVIVNERWSGVRANLRARQLGTKRIAMNQRWLWSGFIRAVSHGGYQLSAYTLNNPKKVQKWQSSGLYGIVTDYPDRFKHLALPVMQPPS
jgi:glycerophosphoryl diester phosphodiesterase